MKSKNKTRNSKKALIKTPIVIGGIILIIAIISVLIFLNNHSKELPKINTSQFKHSESFKKHIVVNGIDVSAIQGKNIDWNKVKSSGIDFVILRAGYSDYDTGKFHKDIMFDKNSEDARKAGLMIGAYMFSQATSKEEAKDEAEFLVDIANEHEIQLPLVMDYELVTGGRLEKALNEGTLDGKTSKIIDSFCSAVEDAGYDSMLYGNYNFLTKTLDINANSKRTNIWIAHYSSETDLEYPYLIWQSSDEGKINGIDGNTDMNFMYLKPSKHLRSHVPENSKRKSLKDAKIVFNKEDRIFRYLNKPINPRVYVKYGIKRLREGKDYDISYIKNSHEGTGYVVITGKGKYKDSIFDDFIIKKWI